jgi:predicted nucleic acid-binding protein
MSVRTDAFFDTNVLLYLLSAEPGKAACAEALLAQQGTISVQVLNEFASVAARKLKMPWSEIREVLGGLRQILAVAPITAATHDRALMLVERISLSWSDALIVASALESGCHVLYSKDMQHGQLIDGRLHIRNPFLTNGR